MVPRISVIIPAFNEQNRLGLYLSNVRNFLDEAYWAGYEVVVVDDGSHDGTVALVEQTALGWRRLRLLRHEVNLGKGAAVRTGVLASTGHRVLFADADGATPITETVRLSAAIDRGALVAAGSRYVVDPGVKRARNWRRALLGGMFTSAAQAMVGVTVKDTQCGFKMFDGAVGRSLFALGRETGYLFDIELLALAERFGYPVAEVAVNWREQPGSKVRIVSDSARMILGLWRVRARLRSIPSRRIDQLPPTRVAA